MLFLGYSPSSDMYSISSTENFLLNETVVGNAYVQ